MEKPIKYKRFDVVVNNVELEELFDRIIIDGFEIIYYNEKPVFDDGQSRLHIIIVAYKKQSNTL